MELDREMMMNGPYAYRNRREGHRVYLRTEIACNEPRGGSYEAALGNLGPGGIFIHAPAPYGAGTRLALRFKLLISGEKRIIEALGEVAWNRRTDGNRLPGFGVRFTQIEGDDARVIHCLLERRLRVSRSLGVA